MHRYINISFLVVLLAVLTSCSVKTGYVTISGFAQGSTYAVKINMDGVGLAPETIKAEVDSILNRIDLSLSGYNGNSILSRFNAGETVVPDSLFLDMYSKAVTVYEQTEECVDAASAPLFDLWGFGFRSGSLPSEEEVASLMEKCGMDRLRKDMGGLLDDEGNLVPGDLLNDVSDELPQLNYNAIAQGYSCDVVAEYLYSIGVKDMMVDIGEIFCDGVNPSGKPWTIGIDRPSDGNDTLGADIYDIFHVPSGPHGVVTSGNYRKYYVRDGKKYAHTIDPRTGYPVTHNLLSATVVASDATLADAYATYCMVIGLEESVAFVSSMPDVEAFLIYDEDGDMKFWHSDGFQPVTLKK